MTRVDKSDLSEYGASGKIAQKFSYIEFYADFSSFRYDFCSQAS